MASDPKLSMEEILRTAIAREAESYVYYHQAAMATDDPELRELLLDYAETEREHSARLLAEVNRLEVQHWLESAVTC
jgi:rubrerythrin